MHGKYKQEDVQKVVIRTTFNVITRAWSFIDMVCVWTIRCHFPSSGT